MMWWFLLQILIYLSIIIYTCCKFSTKFKYFFKNVVYSISLIVSGVIFVPLMLHRPKDSRNGLLPSWGIRVLTKYLLGITYEVRGKENIIPEGQGCVVAINHQHVIDITVMGYLWPHTPKGCMIAKKEILFMFPFGPATWLWGTVFLDRLNPEKAHDTLNITGEHINKNHARICIFPEGTRRISDTLSTFKKGAFHIAIDAQCPIQPVAVSKYHFIDKKKRTLGSGHNIIEILPAIPTKGYTKEQIPELIEKVKKVMQEKFEKISEETKNKCNTS